MIDFDTLFKNHLRSRFISDDGIRKFTEIHIERLVANNGGGDFTQIIADTQNARDQYFGSTTDEYKNYAIQQGLTISVYKVLREFKRFASRSEGVIRGQFDKTSPEYQEFVPNKLKEYWHLNLTNAESVMERFYKAAERHTAELGDGIKDRALALLNEFRSARSNQLKKKGEVSAKKSSAREGRKKLELQLMKNLHYIAYLYPGEVAKCNSFFDQSFLKRKKTIKK